MQNVVRLQPRLQNSALAVDGDVPSVCFVDDDLHDFDRSLVQASFEHPCQIDQPMSFVLP